MTCKDVICCDKMTLTLKMGGEKMTERTFPADSAVLPEVMSFVEEELEKIDCSMKASMQITVSVEEIFVNIANYAYGSEKGEAKIAIDEENGKVIISFVDNGTPFNPLEREAPDITLSAQERSIGGLGIFMVRKTMDDVSYEYKDGRNIFTISKSKR